MLQDAEIFDVDGTLCDVRSIRHLVKGPKRNFHAFHTESASCPPNLHVVEHAQRAHREGRAVLIVTARKRRYERLTSMWLALHGVPSDELFMRGDSDNRPDYEVKLDILALIHLHYRPVKAHDDQPKIASLWESNGIPCELEPGWTD